MYVPEKGCWKLKLLGLEFLTVVSPHAGATKVASALNLRANSPAPVCVNTFFICKFRQVYFLSCN